MELSRLLAALLVRAASTLDTCASAAGLLAVALAAMEDRALTTATPAAPDTLMGADATADSTLSAALWAPALSVELELLATTACTAAAAVLAVAALSGVAVPLAPLLALTTVTIRDSAVLASAADRGAPAAGARLCSSAVCAAANAAPVTPLSCAVMAPVAAVRLAPAEVRFTGG